MGSSHPPCDLPLCQGKAKGWGSKGWLQLHTAPHSQVCHLSIIQPEMHQNTLQEASCSEGSSPHHLATQALSRRDPGTPPYACWAAGHLHPGRGGGRAAVQVQMYCWSHPGEKAPPESSELESVNWFPWFLVTGHTWVRAGTGGLSSMSVLPSLPNPPPGCRPSGLPLLPQAHIRGGGQGGQV